MDAKPLRSGCATALGRTLIISVVGLVACGGDGDGAGSPAAFVGQYATAQCALLRTCCADTDAPVDYDCEGFVRSQYQFAQQAVSAGGLRYDADAAEACLEFLEANAGNCIAGEAPACDRIFVEVGQDGAGVGEACDFQSDCAASAEGDVTCRPPTFGADDVCMLSVRVAEGDACHESCEADSRGGTTCLGGGLREERPVRAGQCWRDDNLRCDGESGTCVALAAAGEACTRASDCGAGLFCGASEGDGDTCQTHLAVGAACRADQDGACGEGYCGADGLCAPPLPLGADCNPAGDEVCAPGADCDRDTMKCQASGGDLGCGLFRALATGGFGGG